MKTLLSLLGFLIYSTTAFAHPSSDDPVERGLLTGQVRTADGKPAEFASVALKNTRFGTTTDANGRFSFRAPVGHHTLHVSMMGASAQEQAVTLEPNQTLTVDLTLASTAQQLDAVTIRERRADTYVVGQPSESLKLNAPLIEVPQNIAITTRQTMLDWGIVSTSELARTVSGVVRTYGDFNDFTFNIRGTDASNNIFRNGVGGYWWNQQEDAAMIERVEFVKGPAGFMIGNSEPGGLVNIVTKQATGERVRSVEIGGGSWNMFRGNVDFGGAITNNGKLTCRFVAGGTYQNGLTDFAQQHRTFLLPSLRYTPRPGTYLQLELSQMNGFSKAGSSPTLPSLDGQLFRIRNSFAIADPNIRGLITRDTYLRLSGAHKLNDVWKLQGHVARIQGYFGGDGMYMTGVSADQQTIYRSYYQNNWRNDLTAAQLFLDGVVRTGSLEHKLLVGLDYGRTAVNSGYTGLIDSTFTRLGLNIQNPQYGLPADSLRDLEASPFYATGQQWLALYAQNHLKIGRKLIVTLAGRINRTSAWMDEGQRTDSTSVSNWAFTPRFGLTYLITENLSVFGVYDQTFLPQIGQKEDRTPARPLTGTNHEIGLKGQFLNGKLLLNLSAYNTVKNNVLVQNPTTSFYVERGQITSRGVDFDVQGNLTPSLNINVNYTFCDARVTADLDENVVGTPNFGTPRHSGNAMARYRFRSGTLAGFAIGAGAQYMGERSAVWAGWNNPADKNIRTPAYTLFDANVSYSRPRYALTVNAFNLTNRQYVAQGGYTSAVDNVPGFWAYTPGLPTNVRASLVVKL